LERIKRFVPTFRYYLDHADQNEELIERHARQLAYRQLISPESLRNMTDLELGQVIGTLGRLELVRSEFERSPVS